MHELAPDHFIDALALFDGVSHSKAIVLAVFEGYHVGRVWVDRRERPRAALLGTASGFSYAAGNPAAGDPSAWASRTRQRSSCAT